MVSAVVGTFEMGPVVPCPNHRIIVGKNVRVITRTSAITVLGALAIPAGTAHTLQTEEDQPLASIFMDVQRYRFKDAERLAEAWRKFEPAQDAPIAFFDEIHRVPQSRIDRRLELSLAHFSVGASVAESAQRLSLSESRLTHLFSEQIGISPRQWRRWLLMRKALFALYTGQSATYAAHFAGFADAAHLSRTCRLLTGATPSQIRELEASFITPRGSVVECAKLRGSGKGPVTRAVTQALLAGGAVGLPQILCAGTRDKAVDFSRE